jgi:P27 family predicted phage terminase small subunit
MKGRKPKPTYLKLVSGNPGKRRMNANEPKPAGNLTAAPDFLTPAQREVWDYAIKHAPNGLLKLLDRDVLLAWVVARDMFQTAVENQRRIDTNNGLPLLTRTPEGHFQQSPYLPIINRQSQIMMKAAEELGFTPSSRSRIQLDPEHVTDPAEKFF